MPFSAYRMRLVFDRLHTELAAYGLRRHPVVRDGSQVVEHAVTLGDGRFAIIRCVERATEQDHADLATMIADGDFTAAYIVCAEGIETAERGPISTYSLSHIDDLIGDLASKGARLLKTDQRSTWIGIFREEAPRLVRRLRAFRGRISPEDLVQTAFAKMLEQDLDAIEDPKAYLTRLVHNLAVDEIRRQNRARVSSFGNDELDAVLASATSSYERSESSPEEMLIARERLAHMLAALRTLPDRERLALLLHKFAGFTHQEIGERLGVSQHSVPRYLSRAVAKCAAALAAFETADGAKSKNSEKPKETTALKGLAAESANSKRLLENDRIRSSDPALRWLAVRVAVLQGNDLRVSLPRRLRGGTAGACDWRRLGW
jgi:RNA polymerase sigma factor (sigma-70 family)